MKDNISIFLKSVGTAIIELLLFIPILILSVLSIEYSENLTSIVRLLFFVMPLSVFLFYILFSNIKYISFSCFILKYRLKTENYTILRMIISNTIFFGLLGMFYWLQAGNSNGFLINCIRFFLLIEFGSCFFPKIKTRMSLFLLKIKWENVEAKCQPKTQE